MSISIECKRCGKSYRVRDDLGGHKLKCRVCGGSIPVPLPHGGQVYRHAPRNRQLEKVAGNLEQIEAISKHIETHIGPVTAVLHELVSDMVHLDIHVVGPTRSRPYTTLVTSGMSDRPMTVPDADESLRYAELMICLPEDWPLDQPSFDDENVYWPIRWLKTLARFPHEYDTWLGWGHTIPNGDPPKPFATETELCCWMLVEPQLAPEKFHRLATNGRVVNFYAIVPLYHQEIAFKLKHGAAKLVERLLENEIEELLDPQRENVGKRSSW